MAISEEIRNLVVRDELEEACQLLRGTKIYKLTSYRLLSRLNRLNRKIYAGTISHDNAQLERNKLSDSLLKIARNIELTSSFISNIIRPIIGLGLIGAVVFAIIILKPSTDDPPCPGSTPCFEKYEMTIPGLIAFYSFDNAEGGTAIDESKNKYNGDITGGAYKRDRGGSYLIENSTFISVPKSDDFNAIFNNSFSFSIWLKDNSPGKDRHYFIFSKKSGARPPSGIWMYKSSESGDIVFAISTDETNGLIKLNFGDNTSSGLGQWINYIITLDRRQGVITGYKKGDFIKKVESNNNYISNYQINNSQDFTIGATSDKKSHSWHGLIDDFAIYEKVLDTAEIKILASKTY